MKLKIETIRGMFKLIHKPCTFCNQYFLVCVIQVFAKGEIQRFSSYQFINMMAQYALFIFLKTVIQHFFQMNFTFPDKLRS